MLRGLHGRTALSEGKLVRCASGSVFEVVLDLRPWSATFLQWDTLVLDDVEHRQLWVPPGFVHGFQAVTAQADICYRMDAVHDPSLDIGLAWNDPDLGIEWPLPDPVLSPRPGRADARRDPPAPRVVVRGDTATCVNVSARSSAARSSRYARACIRHDAREMRR